MASARRVVERSLVVLRRGAERWRRLQRLGRWQEHSTNEPRTRLHMDEGSSSACRRGEPVCLPKWNWRTGDRRRVPARAGGLRWREGLAGAYQTVLTNGWQATNVPSCRCTGSSSPLFNGVAAPKLTILGNEWAQRQGLHISSVGLTLAPLFATCSAAAKWSPLIADCSGVSPCARGRRPNQKIVVGCLWVGRGRGARVCAGGSRAQRHACGVGC